MGWCSGAEVADDVWEVVKEHIPKEKRQKVAKALVDVFESHDCDCMEDTKVGNASGAFESHDT